MTLDLDLFLSFCSSSFSLFLSQYWAKIYKFPCLQTWFVFRRFFFCYAIRIIYSLMFMFVCFLCRALPQKYSLCYINVMCVCYSSLLCVCVKIKNSNPFWRHGIIFVFTCIYIIIWLWLEKFYTTNFRSIILVVMAAVVARTEPFNWYTGARPQTHT